MAHFSSRTLLAASALLLSLPALAVDTTTSGDQQAVVPQIQRSDLRPARFPSNDFEVGLFGGIYGTQNFGASFAGGARVGYHITEDFFAEAAYGQTNVTDEAFRRVLPGGIFTSDTEKLSYYDLSVGWNMLPGEIFLGSSTAKISQVYLIGGLGRTRFVDQREQTFNFGVGVKVFLANWFALRVDMRDHIFTLDLLGKRDSTHNLELTTGASFFF
ncbi:outer membrane beta-barrel domain-containing protein [Ideonella azotifigens]|uniref:Outer membrane protein beta-barrel domain-containing protein n=1 Tax=Ideonella azotifigens TaxID=513160 RepID=A0ABN1KF21_9BURK|nr:outer membrane beta-barrel domain-containing protein [Ideonella azotifigens]MCD2340730.1 outer membrane beta-barrel domain-containing protein [Ideonella azotifigens]